VENDENYSNQIVSTTLARKHPTYLIRCEQGEKNDRVVDRYIDGYMTYPKETISSISLRNHALSASTVLASKHTNVQVLYNIEL
jgi:hypothetical protein